MCWRQSLRSPLAHLTRFAQILSLGDHPTQQPAPFEVTLKPKEKYGTHERPENSLRIQEHNRLSTPLRVHSSQFRFYVKQLYPAEDAPNSVDPGRTVSFSTLRYPPSSVATMSSETLFM